MRPLLLKSKYILSLLLVLMIGSDATAQDIILLKNGEKLKVSIKQIGNEVVNYYEYQDSSITYTLNKSAIESIEKNAVIQDNHGKEKFLNTQIHQIKFDFLSFFNLSLGLSYERMMTPYSSLQPNIAYYNNNDNHGFEIGTDYRIYSTRNRFKNSDGLNLMDGGYTFLRLHYGYQKSSFYNFRQGSFTTEFGTRNSHALIGGVGIGKQWQYDKVTLDVNISYLYFIGWSKEELDTGEPSNVRLVEYNKGIFKGRNNRGVNINFSIGYQF